MPPEAEGIAQDGVHPGFTGLIGLSLIHILRFSLLSLMARPMS